MTPQPTSIHELANTSRHMARGLMTISSNRFELLAIELQEERDHIYHTALLALGATGMGLLAGMTVTATIVITLWATSPTIVLLILSILYTSAFFVLYHLLKSHLRNWQSFSDSLDEFRKDQFMVQELCG